MHQLLASMTEHPAFILGRRTDVLASKRMSHPAVGPITLHYEALALPGDPDQTLFVYTTDPGSPSHDSSLAVRAEPAPGRASSTPLSDASRTEPNPS